MAMIMAIRNIRRPQSGEAGQGLVEYSLILALIAIALVTALTAIGGPLEVLYDTIANAIPTSS